VSDRKNWYFSGTKAGGKIPASVQRVLHENSGDARTGR